jgi:hypothetical protein
MDYETSQRIERLERQVALLYQHLGLNGSEEYMPPSPLLAPPPAFGSAYSEPQDSVPGQQQYGDPRLPPAFFEAVAADKKIQAIKIYREVTGVGLKEAKDYVDALDPNHHKRR